MIKAHIGIQIACWGILFPAGTSSVSIRSPSRSISPNLPLFLSFASSSSQNSSSYRLFRLQRPTDTLPSTQA